MKVLELLKGKKINYMTDAKVLVQLVIENAKEEHNYRDLEPATQKNDWYPPSEHWTTIELEFTNGFKKIYSNLSDIDIIED